MPLLLAVGLIALGTATRLVPHPHNFVPMGALALYAGARLPRAWAFLVPLTAMFLSDVILDWGHGFEFFGVVRFASYGTFAAIAAVSGLLAKESGPPARVGQSLGASAAFFVVSNFAVWLSVTHLSTSGTAYPPTPAGLLMCYAAAVPFFGNTVMADLAGTGVLFGLDALVRRAWARRVVPARA